MRTSNYNFDIDKHSLIKPVVIIRSGDHDIDTIKITLSNQGDPVDLTNAKVKFMGTTPAGNKIIDDVHIKIVDATSGIFEYTFPSAAGSSTGEYQDAYFSIILGNGQTSTMNFRIQVLSGVDISAPAASDYVSQYNTMVSNLNSAYDSATTATNDKMASTVSSLATSAATVLDSALARVNDVDSKANQASSAASNAVSMAASVASTVTSQASYINSVASSAASSVSSVAASVVDTLNNIKVGGRNLLLDTGRGFTAVGNNSINGGFGIYYLAGGKTVADLYNQYGPSGYLTLSFDWEASGDNISGQFNPQWAGNPYGLGDAQAIKPSVNNKSGHYKVSVPFSLGGYSTGNAGGITFRQDNLQANITIKNMKLEAGNVATDWTPAPEDKANKVKTVYNIEDYGAKSFDMNFDNGKVINDILAKIGDNGGTILIPAGDFWLTTPIIVKRNYVAIQGINSGFRSNIDAEVGNGLSHPGAGSHLLLMPSLENGIIIGEKGKTPRISGITIDRINIQGARERSATVSQTGINIIQDNDGVTISNNVIMNLNYGVIGNGSDAIAVRNNWICELQNAVHLLNSSQQPSITNNYFGAQPSGITLKLDSSMCANISGNNIYPDGATNIELNNCTMSMVSGNNIQSFYTGMIMVNGGNNNSISSNMIYARSNGGNWVADPLGRDNKYGIIQISSDNTTVTANHIISEQPVDATRILVRKGRDVRISSNTILGNPSKNKIVCNGVDSSNVVVFNSVTNDEFDSGLNASNRNVWSLAFEDEFVHKTSNETVAGDKTFTGKVAVSGTLDAAQKIYTRTIGTTNDLLITYTRVGNLVTGRYNTKFGGTFPLGANDGFKAPSAYPVNVISYNANAWFTIDNKFTADTASTGNFMFITNDPLPQN